MIFLGLANLLSTLPGRKNLENFCLEFHVLINQCNTDYVKKKILKNEKKTFLAVYLKDKFTYVCIYKYCFIS